LARSSFLGLAVISILGPHFEESTNLRENLR
jgi:hypothetical protein